MGVEELTELMIEIKNLGEVDLELEPNEVILIIKNKLGEHLGDLKN